MQSVLIGFVALIATELVSYSDALIVPTQEPCGYLPPNQPSRQLIHAGKVAEAGQWPWMAFILQRKSNGYHSVCAGSIIDREWILTAAHCLWPSDKASDYCVVVGHNDISDLVWENCAPLGERPLQVIRYPTYNRTAVEGIFISEYSEQQKKITNYDIGLIKMAPISFATTNVGRICLPTEAGNYHGRSCHVAGWGDTETGSMSMHLKSLRSEIWSESECRTKSLYGYWRDGLTYNLYCFGKLNANICWGDSGAPLFCKRSNGQFEAVGVAVGGVGSDCMPSGDRGRASYSIRVPTLLEWISQTMETDTARKNFNNADLLP